MMLTHGRGLEPTLYAVNLPAKVLLDESKRLTQNPNARILRVSVPLPVYPGAVPSLGRFTDTVESRFQSCGFHRRKHLCVSSLVCRSWSQPEYSEEEAASYYNDMEVRGGSWLSAGTESQGHSAAKGAKKSSDDLDDSGALANCFSLPSGKASQFATMERLPLGGVDSCFVRHRTSHRSRHVNFTVGTEHQTRRVDGLRRVEQDRCRADSHAASGNIAGHRKDEQSASVDAIRLAEITQVSAKVLSSHRRGCGTAVIAAGSVPQDSADIVHGSLYCSRPRRRFMARRAFHGHERSLSRQEPTDHGERRGCALSVLNWPRLIGVSWRWNKYEWVFLGSRYVDREQMKTQCIVDDCTRKPHARGVCKACYIAFKRMADAGETNEEQLVKWGLLLPARKPWSSSNSPARKAVISRMP